MMQKSEFYCGLPQDQWDILLSTAEDLLRDEDIGTHLVGLYPAGNRIYGIESESPGILCLYVDTVESLINPAFQSGAPTGFKTILHGNSRSPIIFANLFNWVQHILQRKCTWINSDWLPIIPFAGHLIYQDNSIDDILRLLHKFMQTQQFLIPIGCKQLDYPKDILWIRADAILAKTGKFYPCINPAWDKVHTLDVLNPPKDILETDLAFRNSILNRGPKPEYWQLLRMKEWLQEAAAESRFRDIKWDKQLIEEIGEKVAALYRFTL